MTLVSPRPWALLSRAFRLDLSRPSQRHVAALLQLWSLYDPSESCYFEALDGKPAVAGEAQLRLEGRFAEATGSQLRRPAAGSAQVQTTT